jgi:hypothetical protein
MFQTSAAPECSHCHSLKSPLWRRGEKGEVLCNACGLYWRNHGSKRPLNLKRPLTPPRDQSHHAGIGKGSTDLGGSTRNSRHQHQVHVNAYSEWQESMKRVKMELIDKPPTPAADQLGRSDGSSALVSSQVSPSVPSMPKFKPTPALETAFCRFPLPKDLAKMKDVCDPISIVDLKPSAQDTPYPNKDMNPTPQSNSNVESVSPKKDDYSHEFMQKPHHICVDDDILAIPSTGLSPFDYTNSALRCKKAPLFYFNRPYYVGDIVLVKGRMEDQYFGRIDHFFVNEYDQKFFSMTWMIPRRASVEKLENVRSISMQDLEEANAHHGIESMDCILGVVLDAATIYASKQIPTKIGSSIVTKQPQSIMNLEKEIMGSISAQHDHSSLHPVMAQPTAILCKPDISSISALELILNMRSSLKNGDSAQLDSATVCTPIEDTQSQDGDLHAVPSASTSVSLSPTPLSSSTWNESQESNPDSHNSNMKPTINNPTNTVLCT